MTYSDKLRDPRWQKRRLEILQRDGWKCQDCGDEKHELQVHHTAYSREPWDALNACLMTLCGPCHEHRQDQEDELRLTIGIITRRMSPVELGSFVWDTIQQSCAQETAIRNREALTT